MCKGVRENSQAIIIEQIKYLEILFEHNWNIVMNVIKSALVIRIGKFSKKKL